MKQILFAVAGLVLLSLIPATSMAGVVGSSHDLHAGDTTAAVCATCHIPHNALGEKLWADTVGDTTAWGLVGALCYTCHDGSVSDSGLTTVFDTTLQQHKTVGSGCSDATGGCHDVHNQNPNGTGQFLLVTQVSNSYCIDCHDDNPLRSNSLGDHRTSAGGNHKTTATFKCEQCHTPHGATAQGNNPGSLTHPILLADNHPSAGSYGAFCVDCHQDGTAPSAAVGGTGGQVSSDTAQYVETVFNGDQIKHTTQGGNDNITGCNYCHDVHGAGSADSTTLLKSANDNSAYCKSCHETGGNVPGVGGRSHTVQAAASNATMNTGGSYEKPWADEINDDDAGGVDYAGGTADYIVCESCHSVHRKGFSGTDEGNLLRAPNGVNNTVCRECHTDQGG
jgi:predicted CXXCH cytochrome family protein